MLKRIVPRVYNPIDYPCDVERLVAIALAAGYVLSANDAQTIWSEFSDTYCAGWLFLPDEDDAVLQVLLDYGEVSDA